MNKDLNIQHICSKYKISKARLADILNVNPSHIYHLTWKSGKQELPISDGITFYRRMLADYDKNIHSLENIIDRLKDTIR